MTSIVVCGTQQRAERGEQLAATLNAELVLDFDQQPTINHARAWEATLDLPDEWCLVVEDDVVPAANLLKNLPTIEANTPTNIVSLYLGKGWPKYPQHDLSQIFAYNRGDSPEKSPYNRDLPAWIVADKIMSHVALLVRRDLVPGLARSMRDRPLSACDVAADLWCRRKREPVAYCVPSPVNHADQASTVTDRHLGERTAWLAGDWSPGGTVMLDRATRRRYGDR